MKAVTDQIFNWGMEGAPEERCGIVVMETPQEFRVVQLRNRAEDPTRMYKIDPNTLRTMALKPDLWSHVAIWHTHPNGMVGPSAGDLEYKIPTLKYLVVTIPTGEVVTF